MTNFFIPDIARTAEDFERIADLIGRLSPESPLPPLGRDGNKTYVLRDEADRRIIVGVAHVEWVPEVQCMLMEPDHSMAKYGYFLLHRGMEMNLRQWDVQRYYMTVPKDDRRVNKMFEVDGAERIDQNMIRYLKRL